MGLIWGYLAKVGQFQVPVAGLAVAFLVSAAIGSGNLLHSPAGWVKAQSTHFTVWAEEPLAFENGWPET